MGTCGCAEDYSKYLLPMAADGMTYTLGIYPGCGGCGLGPEVVVYRHDPDDPHRRNVPSPLTSLPWQYDETDDDAGGGPLRYAESRLSVISPAGFAAALSEYVEEPACYDAESMIHDLKSGAGDLLHMAVCETKMEPE